MLQEQSVVGNPRTKVGLFKIVVVVAVASILEALSGGGLGHSVRGMLETRKLLTGQRRMKKRVLGKA